ncbi:hypothetical protein E2C01_041800 [Portunus trituberculatus]|uniref:Uncharacterized protein n=1 Tax=Portunus trituberculatus TaxID=210409 RepID=A0A5B7FRM1_PORTR|nr:hypothetical protein [Portunus trituberculatus]
MEEELKADPEEKPIYEMRTKEMNDEVGLNFCTDKIILKKNYITYSNVANFQAQEGDNIIKSLRKINFHSSNLTAKISYSIQQQRDNVPKFSQALVLRGSAEVFTTPWAQKPNTLTTTRKNKT